MKKKCEYFNDDINILDLDKNIIDVLKGNSINKIEDLWLNNRKNLKSMGLTDKDIKYISIKMQLLGVDLNKKIY